MKGVLTLALLSTVASAVIPNTSYPYIDTIAIVVKAVAVLSGDSAVKGFVTFDQTDVHSLTTISWNITGSDPNTKRGIHIHDRGDLTQGCTSTGSHFNPYNMTHGAPNDTTRHLGDMGNYMTDSQGNSVGNLQDSLIKLNGPLSIVGRAVVVHAQTDDLGRGGNAESLKTGNAGARLACGVIGIAKEIFVPTSQMSNSTSGSASGSITPTATGSATSGNAVPLTNGGGSSLVNVFQYL
ncbi:hypothetical protein EYB26_007497 [Talaromyces marneffei]|uniref:uncharacterized protein n=1 Tax=Talaromyces marneffei TaxID=37727 RepID=UPI0012A94C0D|nr:uncharacterized protein EYB26_007497 [Talaromyces marneffei]QGA19803.1 hypothetical protein EYB26_007497 [Talaromyces marneffei]